jgi:hypothetical protein
MSNVKAQNSNEIKPISNAKVFEIWNLGFI